MAMDFSLGTPVRVRGDEWHLAAADRFGPCRVVTLEGTSQGNAGRRLRVIEPFDRLRPIGARGWRRRSRHSTLRAAAAAIARARPPHGLWCAAAANIDLHAYQLEPALAVLGGATRLLLADAVGLGKTIQAGLVLAELAARGWVERALVVCPVGLREGWAREFRHRFGLACVVLDQPALAAATASLPPGVNPWATHPIAIASLDFIKRPEVLAAASAVPFDLLIADEVHHLTPGTDRGRAIDRLAARAPWCIFVSATPHSGDRAAFDYLTGLGAHADAIALFRRTRDAVGLPQSRRRSLLPITPRADDRELLDAVESYSRAIWNAARAPLVAITLARRAASCPLALERSLIRRRLLLSHSALPVQARLPWDETDGADDDLSMLAAPGLDDAAGERHRIDALIDAARRCGPGAKIRRLRRLLACVREPAIVFTEYRDSAEAVVAALPSAWRIASLHGGLTGEQRRLMVDAFNARAIDVLVATDAAGEGLNLQQQCRLVIDLELPWNPLRLEQRVGRVDRLGQRRRVHAISLVHVDGIEERVLRHLQARQGRALAEVALTAVSEMDLARAVFDGIAPPAPATPLPARASTDAATSEADRLARIRRHVWQPPARPPWAAPRHHRRSTMAVLRCSTVTNRAGRVIGDHLDAWTVDLARPADRHQWCDVPAAIAVAQPPVQLGPLAPRWRVGARLEAIRRLVLRAHRVERQVSLFDRRAERGAEQDRGARAQRLSWLARREASVDETPADTHGRLVAIWPWEPR